MLPVNARSVALDLYREAVEQILSANNRTTDSCTQTALKFFLAKQSEPAKLVLKHARTKSEPNPPTQLSEDDRKMILTTLKSAKAMLTQQMERAVQEMRQHIEKPMDGNDYYLSCSDEEKRLLVLYTIKLEYLEKFNPELVFEPAHLQIKK